MQFHILETRIASFNQLGYILECFILRAYKCHFYGCWHLAFDIRPHTTLVFHGKINYDLQTCPVEYHFKECNVPWIIGLYLLFILSHCYQTYVDQFINIKKFCLGGVYINYLNGRFVEILCCFFCLPMNWVERLLKGSEFFAVWLWTSCFASRNLSHVICKMRGSKQIIFKMSFFFKF